MSLVRNDGGVRVKTAKYEAAIGADGCLTSFTAGGVEFLRPGEPLFNGKTVARGAYFYYEKPPHQGVVQMPNIELPQGQANVVKASGDKFSVTYEFTPDAVRIKAANATDDLAPFFVVLDSVPVAEVVNGAGERLTVPTVALPDAKWATTTWKAGRNALTIHRTNGGDVKLWGPFGQARSQVWEGDVASYGAADILLEPSVVTDEKPAVPPGGVLITRQGGARRVRTDLYETVVDSDGCVPSLRVDGVEFFKSGVSISRGAYFHQANTELLPDVVQIGPAVLVASGKNAGIFYAFGPDKLTWALENRTNAAMAFFIVFDPTVIAVRNAKNEWLKVPVGGNNAPSDPKWAKTTWYAGRAKITITGGSRIWGPWPDAKGYQVWEASLAPNEKRTVVIETALATPDEAKQAAATAGVDPPALPELSVYGPLDYQVVQRKTREHGDVPISGRVRPDFDRLEARVTGKAMDERADRPVAGAADSRRSALLRPDAAGPGGRLVSAGGAGAEGRQKGGRRRGGTRRRRRGVRRGRPIQLDELRPGADAAGLGYGVHVQRDRVAVGRRPAAGHARPGAEGLRRRQLLAGVRRRYERSLSRPHWRRFHGPFRHERQRLAAGRRAVSVDDDAHGPTRQSWLPGRAVAPGRIGHRHEPGRIRPQDDGPHPGDARGGRLGRSVVRRSGHLPSRRGAESRDSGGAKKLWESGLALQGPDTDQLTGDDRDEGGKGIHFSPKGLAAHGKLWADKVGDWLDKQLAK